MSKLITYAGVSVPLGKTHYVFRTATGQRRIDQLVKLGDLKIDLLPLPRPMSKQEAAQYLLDKAIYADAQDIEAVVRKVANKKV